MGAFFDRWVAAHWPDEPRSSVVLFSKILLGVSHDWSGHELLIRSESVAAVSYPRSYRIPPAVVSAPAQPVTVFTTEGGG